VGLIKHVLKIIGIDIPIGSYKPDKDKKCVSNIYYKMYGNFNPSKPDGLGYEIMKQSIDKYPDCMVLTGGPLHNLGQLLEKYPELKIKKWVAQGGFAGDNVVPEEFRLSKFKGKITCATYNFNGAPKEALLILQSPNIGEKVLVSKNVCHGVYYDKSMHQKMHAVSNNHLGLKLIYDGMDKYLQRKPDGKLFHDPLAACVMIEPSICEFREVELYREKGNWGSKLKSGTNTFISISVNLEKFTTVLTCRIDNKSHEKFS